MSELTSRIEEYYATLRTKAEGRAERCLERALQNPSFSEVDRSYQKARIAYLRAEAEYPERLEQLEQDFTAVRRKRAGLLQEMGLKESDLVPSYTCPRCRDTGFLENGSACSCYREALRRFKLEEIGIASEAFASFDDANKRLVPQINYDYYRVKYCGRFPKVPLSTVFMGSTGTGKTFLASCIAGELEKKGKNVYFLSAISLNRFFLQCFEKESYRSLSLLTDCDLLIIDDLGAEPVYKKVTVEYLKLILDERFSKKHPVLFTTNLNREKIFERYGERIYSRIFDEANLDENNLFQGEDLRTKKR